MKLSHVNQTINVSLPTANAGKFRFKTRNDPFQFGESVGTRQNGFVDSVYLEWQIGYDVEVGDAKKVTSLTQLTFVGDNGKAKYPFELSEIYYTGIELGLTTVEETIALQNEVAGYDEMMDDRIIEVEGHARVELNGLAFEEARISLPAFFLSQEGDGTQIEVHIKQQQYASGYQPMVYFCIPFRCFANCNDFAGRASQPGERFNWIVNRGNFTTVKNLFRVFGMASRRHQYDAGQILDTLVRIAKL